MPTDQILVVDDEPLMRDFLSEAFCRKGYQVNVAPDGLEAIQMLQRRNYDVVLTDVKMPKLSGLEVLKQVKKYSPETKVVLITAYGTIENAVESMKLGAFDYITKPFSVEEIELVVKRALDYQRLVDENKRLRSELDQKYGFNNIVGKSEKMQNIFDLVRTVARSRSTVLITGESGTGKELIAKAIHYNSPRKNKPFVKMNCAAVPSELMESELFGHEKGAFTGAIKQRIGRFEQADGGSLLLDEISEMPPALQAKLLRVLQEREFERVGGTKTIRVDVRIIATTNKDLKQEIERGRFREDLFYRLNVIPIELPPLRQRKEDIPLLSEHFLQKYNRENGASIKQISPEVLRVLMNYDWPGNVRELENCIERAVVVCKGKELTLKDLPEELVTEKSNIPTDASPQVGSTLKEIEKAVILNTLRKYGGNRTQTAKVLGITVRTLRNKLAEYKRQQLESKDTAEEKSVIERK